MLARMMLFGSNAGHRPADQPSGLESITAVNNGVRDFKGTVLFAPHDHEFVQTIATRIIEIREQGVLDKGMHLRRVPRVPRNLSGLMRGRFGAGLLGVLVIGLLFGAASLSASPARVGLSGAAFYRRAMPGLRPVSRGIRAAAPGFCGSVSVSSDGLCAAAGGFICPVWEKTAAWQQTRKRALLWGCNDTLGGGLDSSSGRAMTRWYGGLSETGYSSAARAVRCFSVDKSGAIACLYPVFCGIL